MEWTVEVLVMPLNSKYNVNVAKNNSEFEVAQPKLTDPEDHGICHFVYQNIQYLFFLLFSVPFGSTRFQFLVASV